MNIDFTNCKELINDFGGSEKKKKIIYNNEIYMMKFPDPVRELNNNLSYMNNQFSEYIGSHIYELCNIKVQKTLLGTYIDKTTDKQKIVVACRSFENDNLKLVEFSKFLLSSHFDSKNNEKLLLNEILDTIQNDTRINSINNIKSFYNTIIIDTLIGNGDRHQDNFGFVYNVKSNNEETIEFSPVYDNGSCLSPLLSDKKMEILLNNENDFKTQEYNLTYRYCDDNKKKIFMHEFFNNPNGHLKSAILRNYQNINIDKINKLIDNTPYLNETRKEYFKKAIKLRYDLIITPAYKRTIKEVNEQKQNENLTNNQTLK